MKIHRPSKGLRGIAAVVLTSWVGALLLCSAEPWLGHGHSRDSDHYAEAEPASNSHGHDNDSEEKAPHEGGFCAALKATILSSAQLSLHKPKLECIGVLNPAFLVPDTSIELFDALVLRQAKRPVLVITHEVCTSPANRSLAPPLLS